MHSHPPTHADPDAGDLAVLDPHPRQPLASTGSIDTFPAQEHDDRLLQGAKVVMQIASVVVEVENGIADQLSRSVKRRLTATIDLHDGVGQTVQILQAGAVPGTAYRVDRIVFQQQHGIADRPGLTPLHQRVLQGERLRVGDATQPAEFGTGDRRCGEIVQVRGIKPRIRPTASGKRGPRVSLAIRSGAISRL